LPIALTIDFGKTLTYVSYGLVPASLTHTAKASAPVFSVLVSKIMFNQMPSLATGLSLLPMYVETHFASIGACKHDGGTAIGRHVTRAHLHTVSVCVLVRSTIGVTLSALTEINWVFLGFLAAVTAALANVLNSTYTKRALSSTAVPVDPLILHMYTACAAMVLLLPWALLVELPSISLVAHKQAALESSLATREFRVLHGGQTPVPYPSALPQSSMDPNGMLLPLLHVFPFRAMLLSLLLHYAQNISNIYYLRGVSVLTHQVAQALKRLLNITGAVLYFGNHVTWLNVAGMALALMGFTMYSMAKEKINVQQQAEIAGTLTTGRRPVALSGISSSPANSSIQLRGNGGSAGGTNTGFSSRSNSPRNGNDAAAFDSGNGGSSSSIINKTFVVSPTTLLIEGAHGGHSSLVPLSREGGSGGGGSGGGGVTLPSGANPRSNFSTSTTSSSSASGSPNSGGSNGSNGHGFGFGFSSSGSSHSIPTLGGSWGSGSGGGGLPRTDSMSSFSASPEPFQQHALHPTAHAQMMAAAAAQQQQQGIGTGGSGGGGGGASLHHPSSSPSLRLTALGPSGYYSKSSAPSSASSPLVKPLQQLLHNGAGNRTGHERDLDN
jgi:hypothetical protein